MLVVGASGSTLVIFILPGIFYYTIHRINLAPRLGSDSCDPNDDFRRHTHRYVSTLSESESSEYATNPMNNSRPAADEDAVAAQYFAVGFSNPPLTGSWKTHAALGMFISGIIIGPLALVFIFYS